MGNTLKQPVNAKTKTLFGSSWRITRCWEAPISFKTDLATPVKNGMQQLDVSALTTMVVKACEFSFVIHIILKESIGSQEARLL